MLDAERVADALLYLKAALEEADAPLSMIVLETDDGRTRLLRTFERQQGEFTTDAGGLERGVFIAGVRVLTMEELAAEAKR